MHAKEEGTRRKTGLPQPTLPLRHRLMHAPSAKGPPSWAPGLSRPVQSRGSEEVRGPGGGAKHRTSTGFVFGRGLRCSSDARSCTEQTRTSCAGGVHPRARCLAQASHWHCSPFIRMGTSATDRNCINGAAAGGEQRRQWERVLEFSAISNVAAGARHAADYSSDRSISLYHSVAERDHAGHWTRGRQRGSQAALPGEEWNGTDAPGQHKEEAREEDEEASIEEAEEEGQGEESR